ncbi:terminase large subunit [Aquabacterium sp. A7-Y]|uniref:terminase large subunit n=1 Tax=Aquabacterium sp. A7-Y TaxID=1349605 RepID=UPI00223DA6BD|nr:terminase TerL endonuclease subunit [Aquabacterium sp. A7-Y]MCW7542005.1 terminase large subunit [Aquabacterium sp. A7-Y]
MSHVHDALKYAADVTAGRIPAGRYVRRAVERHLNDLKRAKNKAWAYTFDAAKAERVCKFVELLPHTKGRWAAKGECIRLQPWQKFIFCVLFGWVRKKDGRRRFRAAYLEIPRKNGKSIIAAGVGLYMMLMDGEFGAEVYSGATTEKQAWEVFRPAKLMLERTPQLREFVGAEVWAKALVKPSDGSKFEPIIGNPGDGSSPSCALVDEFHEHDTPALYDTMETGMGAREQPLMFVITTAGYNIAGPCFDKHTELAQVLDGVTENDELFGMIFGIDPEDDWADPQLLIKANPNFGVSVDADFLLSQQRQAMLNPVQQNKFKTKHLNVWCSVLAGLMNMQQWALCADPLLDEDELIGTNCWIALDLASKSDLCAEQRLYRRLSHRKPHFYLFGRYWLPEAAIEEPGPNHAKYVAWVKKGLLTQTDGATVDFELITETVKADCKRINPKEVVYDPFNATQLAQALMADGIEAVEFIQNPANFAVPIDELQAAVKDGRFHHDGNEITTWCMANVVARRTKKGLSSPVKQKGQDHQKIDGAVAAFIAMARAAAVDAPDDVPAIINLDL